MKKEEKSNLVAELNSRLERAKGSFLVDYQGLNVETMNRLRGELRKVGTELQVVKNRLLKLASENTGTAAIKDKMQGPSALAITYEDLVGPAKVLVGFAKEFDRLKIKHGQISGRIVAPEDVRKLATLPPRDVLLAQTLSVMQAVPASFVRVLNGVAVQFLYVLKAIEEKKAEQ
jgi:large subunit ribosomal protein L10